MENFRREKMEHKQTKMEKELTRKVEELRKEAETTMLKEQSLLEEKANGEKALQRKKESVEKANSFITTKATIS